MGNEPVELGVFIATAFVQLLKGIADPATDVLNDALMHSLRRCIGNGGCEGTQGLGNLALHLGIDVVRDLVRNWFDEVRFQHGLVNSVRKEPLDFPLHGIDLGGRVGAQLLGYRIVDSVLDGWDDVVVDLGDDQVLQDCLGVVIEDVCHHL